MLAALAVFGLSFIQEKSAVESFMFAVSLAVAAVPEGLPAISFAFSPGSDGIMRQPPRKIKSLLDAADFQHLLSLGALMVVP